MAHMPKILPISPDICLIWPYIPFKGDLKGTVTPLKGSNGLSALRVRAWPEFLGWRPRSRPAGARCAAGRTGPQRGCALLGGLGYL